MIFIKDMTDFVLLDEIYQSIDREKRVKNYILFTGDGHFQSVARYLKDHSASPETIFAVDVDTMELIVQAKNAGEEDILVLDGEEDVFDVEEETVEENEEVWEAIDEALSEDDGEQE